MSTKDADQIAAANDAASSETIEIRSDQASDDGRDDPAIMATDAVPSPASFTPVKTALLVPRGASRASDITGKPRLLGLSSHDCDTRLSHNAVLDHQLTVSNHSDNRRENCSTRLSLFEAAQIERLNCHHRHSFEKAMHTKSITVSVSHARATGTDPASERQCDLAIHLGAS